MSKFDVEYLKLCKKILAEGIEVENRTGTNTIKIPGYFFKFDLQEELPILTTKQVFFTNAILEMLWFYLAQSNDVKWLQERGNHIWDEWKMDENAIWKANQNMLQADGTFMKQEVAKQFPLEFAHTIGTAYGYIINKYDMTQKLIQTIKTNPNDRRMIMSLWQDEFLETAVLPSCVWNTMWDVTDGKLTSFVTQRSCDVPLGLPFNVTQYAILTNMIAHVTDLKVGEMFYMIKDAHIYVNQVEGIKKQIERGEKLEDLPAPTLWLNPEIKDFFDFDTSRELKDIKIKNYKHHGPIKFPISA